MLQATGLGGWMFDGIDRLTMLGASGDPDVPGLGLRFDTDERWALANPTGPPGVLEALCPPIIQRWRTRSRPSPDASSDRAANNAIGQLIALSLPQVGLDEVYQTGPDAIIAGTAVAGDGTASPVDGGYRVSGRWPFGSRCRESQWMMANFDVAEGDQLRRDPDGTPALYLERRAHCRLAASYAVDSARQTVDLVYRAGGTTSSRRSHQLARSWRDLHVVAQAASVAPDWYETTGRTFLGLDPGDRLK